MASTPAEDGLRVVDPATETDDAEARAAEDGHAPIDLRDDPDLESLRDEFVDAFNARDLEAVLAIVHPDVECPDIAGDGIPALSEELEAIWERSPGAVLTRAFLDDTPCAVGWLPDEDGCWCRAALVCFDADDSSITLVEVPDDADALERAAAEEPAGDELDEWVDWAEWERGEETPPGQRR